MWGAQSGWNKGGGRMGKASCWLPSQALWFSKFFFSKQETTCLKSSSWLQRVCFYFHRVRSYFAQQTGDCASGSLSALAKTFTESMKYLLFGRKGSESDKNCELLSVLVLNLGHWDAVPSCIKPIILRFFLSWKFLLWTIVFKLK